MKIALSDHHTLDLESLVSTRLLVQANSGGGKSYCLRRLLEQSHGKVQHLVIDPEGEFSTLRERFDYVLASRRGGDTAAEPRIARLLAERLLELQASAILDIYELRAHERIQFVRAFLEALVEAPKRLWHPVLVVVDEAHVYCPQQGEAESAGAVIDLATRGRKRGFAAVLATQRLSKLHKDAAAECNNKLIGRTGLDVDVKRAADELGFGKERWRELRDLPPGRFFGFGPALSREVTTIAVGTIKTTHPTAGGRIATAAPPTPEKVRALLPKLADLPAEAEERQKSIEDLRRENQHLRRDLAAAKKASPAPARVEVSVLGPKDATRLERVAEQLSKAATTAATASRDVAEKLGKVVRSGASVHGERAAEIARYQAKMAGAIKNDLAVVHYGNPAAAPRARSNGQDQAPPPISGSQQRILDSLLWLESLALTPADKVQVALLADQSPRSGNYANNLGKLRTLGLITYPRPGAVALLDAGRAAARSSEIPTTDEELHDQLFKRCSGSQARILRELIAAYPKPIPKPELAERARQSATSGSFANNLGSLRSLGLIDYPSPGHAVALPVLFLEAQ